MREYPVYCGGVCVGALQMEREGLYMRCRAVCGAERQGVYRLCLRGTNGSMHLGVLEPHDGQLLLEKRCSAASLAAIGESCHAFLEACGDAGDGWECVCEPMRFFSEAALWQGIAHISGMLWRRQGERRELAIPFAEGERFPLPELMCLARVFCVRGKRCTVFASDGEGRPIF